MIDIDKLTGYDLTLALVLELGWVRTEGMANPDWWTTPEGKSRHVPPTAKASLLPHEFTPAYVRSWELDEEGWMWESEEYDIGKLSIKVFSPDFGRLGSSLVNIDDFTSKREAYAVAHCRTWYKARQAMKSAAF
jgi:hypothetical protein